MAKQSGLGARFLVGGYDISGDVSAIDSAKGGLAALDVTGISQSAHQRIGGLRDGSMGITVFMDPANAHPVLSSLPTADTLMQFWVPPMAVGSPVASLNAKQVNYDPTRSAAGDLTLKVTGDGDGFGLEWCQALTPGVRADSAATNGASLAAAAATAYGAQAYLQVTQFTGTSATITVQESPDNTTWSTLVAFAAVTAAPNFQRVTVSNTTTVQQYLRVISAGTFTALSFACAVDRNLVAGVAF